MLKIITALMFVILPVFAGEAQFTGCLDNYQDNEVKDVQHLKKRLIEALNSSATFKAALKTIDQFSACPQNEPGTDSYFVFSKANAEVNGDELVVRYENVRQLTTKDGKHYTSAPSAKEAAFKYAVFKTEKGMRFGNRESRLIIGEGLYLTEQAAQDRFHLATKIVAPTIKSFQVGAKTFVKAQVLNISCHSKNSKGIKELCLTTFKIISSKEYSSLLGRSFVVSHARGFGSEYSGGGLPIIEIMKKGEVWSFDVCHWENGLNTCGGNVKFTKNDNK
jgi:hypothetical protein